MRPLSNPRENLKKKKTAHIVRLPTDCGFSRGIGNGMVIGAAYQNGCCGGQIEGHPALAWLGVAASLSAAPI